MASLESVLSGMSLREALIESSSAIAWQAWRVAGTVSRFPQKLRSSVSSQSSPAFKRTLLPPSILDHIQRFRMFGEALFAATFHRVPTVITQLIFLAGKTIKKRSASGPAVNTRAKLLGVGAAGPAVLRTVSILCERNGGE